MDFIYCEESKITENFAERNCAYFLRLPPEWLNFKPYNYYVTLFNQFTGLITYLGIEARKI